MSNKQTRIKTPRVRPTISLSPGFIALLHEQLEGNRVVQAAVGGIHEGRQLQGSYAMRIVAVALVPIEDAPAESNGHKDNT